MTVCRKSTDFYVYNINARETHRIHNFYKFSLSLTKSKRKTSKSNPNNTMLYKLNPRGAMFGGRSLLFRRIGSSIKKTQPLSKILSTSSSSSSLLPWYDQPSSSLMPQRLCGLITFGILIGSNNNFNQTTDMAPAADATESSVQTSSTIAVSSSSVSIPVAGRLVRRGAASRPIMYADVSDADMNTLLQIDNHVAEEEEAKDTDDDGNKHETSQALLPPELRSYLKESKYWSLETPALSDVDDNGVQRRRQRRSTTRSETVVTGSVHSSITHRDFSFGGSPINPRSAIQATPGTTKKSRSKKARYQQQKAEYDSNTTSDADDTTNVGEHEVVDDELQPPPPPPPPPPPIEDDGTDRYYGDDNNDDDEDDEDDDYAPRRSKRKRSIDGADNNNNDDDDDEPAATTTTSRRSSSRTTNKRKRLIDGADDNDTAAAAAAAAAATTTSRRSSSRTTNTASRTVPTTTRKTKTKKQGMKQTATKTRKKKTVSSKKKRKYPRRKAVIINDDDDPLIKSRKEADPFHTESNGSCKKCNLVAKGKHYSVSHALWCPRAQGIRKNSTVSDAYLEDHGIVWDKKWNKSHKSYYKTLVAGKSVSVNGSAAYIKFLIDTKMWNDCTTAYDKEYRLEEVTCTTNIKKKKTILKRNNPPPLNRGGKQHKHADGILRRNSTVGGLGYPAPCVTFYKWIKMPDQDYKIFSFSCKFLYYFLHKFREVHTKTKKKRTAWEQQWYTAVVKKGDVKSTGLHVSHRDSDSENHDLEFLIIEPDKNNAARWMHCFGHGECTDCQMKYKNPQCKCNPICSGVNVFCCEDCVANKQPKNKSKRQKRN